AACDPGHVLHPASAPLPILLLRPYSCQAQTGEKNFLTGRARRPCDSVEGKTTSPPAFPSGGARPEGGAEAGCGLRARGLLPSEFLGGELAQLVVDQRQELFRSVRVALGDGVEHLRDRVHGPRTTVPQASPSKSGRKSAPLCTVLSTGSQEGAREEKGIQG